VVFDRDSVAPKEEFRERQPWVLPMASKNVKKIRLKSLKNALLTDNCKVDSKIG